MSPRGGDRGNTSVERFSTLGSGAMVPMGGTWQPFQRTSDSRHQSDKVIIEVEGVGRLWDACLLCYSHTAPSLIYDAVWGQCLCLNVWPHALTFSHFLADKPHNGLGCLHVNDVQICRTTFGPTNELRFLLMGFVVLWLRLFLNVEISIFPLC